jgi:hypothetical protein
MRKRRGKAVIERGSLQVEFCPVTIGSPAPSTGVVCAAEPVAKIQEPGFCHARRADLTEILHLLRDRSPFSELSTQQARVFTSI